MKVKLRKKYGAYEIVVCNKDMNAQYDYTNSDPIVLASLFQYDKTEFWCLKDIRLQPHASGFSSLAGHSIQFYECKNKEQYNHLTKDLKFYESKGNKVVWSSFHGVVFPGDKIDQIENNILVPKTADFCWSFTKAKEHLSQLLEFWNNYAENDLDDIAIENPHAQITDMMYMAQSENLKNTKKIKMK